MFYASRTQLRSTTPSHEARAERSSQTSQSDERYQPENHRRYHHEGEASGGSCEIQKGLDLRAGIARSRLLNLVHHFATQLRPPMENGYGQRLENGRHAEKHKAADGAEPGSGSRPDHCP
jgi:hypothetical protein